MHYSVRYWGDGVKLIYRHYATLYFVFAVDQQESDLGILDLIQGTIQRFVILPKRVREGANECAFADSVCGDAGQDL